MRQLLLFTLIAGLAALMISPLEAQQPTSTPLPQAGKLVIRVWWPDSLYALDDQAVIKVLEDQIEAFNRANDQYSVNVRLKKQEGQGSILSTLIAAQPVASSALPDLVILHQNDLVQAAREGVIRAIDDWAPDALRTDLLPNTLALGDVDGKLYGLPYAISLQHMLYQTALFRQPPLSFEAVLESERRFLLPGMPPANQEVNSVLAAQYLAAGGRLVDDAGVPTLDQEPLLEVLAFYAEGIRAGIFSNEILTFSQPLDYWQRLKQGDNPLAVVNSTLYLQNIEDTEGLAFSPLPTPDGQGALVLSGWLWALTATDPAQQDGALAFLRWMMDAEAQADYTQAFGVLPSRRRALRIWTESDYLTQVEDWLSRSIIIPASQRNNAAAAQLQAAFEAVIGGVTAEEAARQALSGLSSRQ